MGDQAKPAGACPGYEKSAGVQASATGTARPRADIPAGTEAAVSRVMRKEASMNSSLKRTVVLALVLSAAGCDAFSSDEPSTVTFRVRNSYNGCSTFGDNWCMYVSCDGYEQQQCFPTDQYCERQFTFENVPPEGCMFRAGGEFAAQYEVPAGKSCSLFFERISGGGYFGIQPQWLDYGLDCN
jgi:hypothetical protein